jgi:protein SCO1/2/putative membrane protein
MIEVRDLPAVNASLNVISTCLLLYGRRLIRNGDRESHRKTMLAALTTSALFLACYLIYHAQVGSVPFQRQGPIRVIYFAILISHVVLAAFVPILAGVTLWRALQGEFHRHKRIARWTYPIWLYVSVTGVVVYLMLYQL